MTHIFAQQPDPNIHLDALKRDGRERACVFPSLLEPQACETFPALSPFQIELIASPSFMFPLGSLFTSMIISLASFGISSFIHHCSMEFKWGHFDSNMLSLVLYSNDSCQSQIPEMPHPITYVFLLISRRCLSRIYMKVVSQLSDNNPWKPSPLQLSARKPG